MAKNIIICSDGTGQKSDSENISNVIRLCSLLKLEDPNKQDSNKQVCCYDAGLGTFTTKGGLDKLMEHAQFVHPFPDEEGRFQELRRRFVKVPLGKMGGFFLEENVEQLYKYLAKYYVEGDHIYLFGFSRGAFTVRVLAGLLDRCGLLPRDKLDLFSKAYHEHYKNQHYRAILNLDERKRIEQEDAKFRDDNHAIRCRIRFLGIWDTVKAYGYFWPLGLPNTRHNIGVDIVRHAVSLDERRSTFLHTTWGWGESDAEEGCDVPTPDKLDVKEVWFAGDHSDVGGGWPKDESDLAKQSLQWMIGEAWEASKKNSGPPLLINENYKDMFDEEPLYIRHDRMSDWKSPISTIGWWFSHRSPRFQLKNCPYPYHEIWLVPTGRRNINGTTRGGKISIHKSVEKAYGKNAKDLCEDWKQTGRLSKIIDARHIEVVSTTEVKF